MAEITNNHGTDGASNKMSLPASTTPSTDGVAKQAREVASNVSGQAKDLATEVVHQAKDMVTSQVAHQQAKSAHDLQDVAKTLRQTLRQTNRQLDGNVVAPYVEKAADQMEKVSTFLRTTNLNEVKGIVEGFARREPLLFLSGAFFLGVLGARFLKSSPHAVAGGPAATNGSSAYSSPSGTQPAGMRRP